MFTQERHLFSTRSLTLSFLLHFIAATLPGGNQVIPIMPLLYYPD